jgi:hypothetical protein
MLGLVRNLMTVDYICIFIEQGYAPMYAASGYGGSYAQSGSTDWWDK